MLAGRKKAGKLLSLKKLRRYVGKVLVRNPRSHIMANRHKILKVNKIMTKFKTLENNHKSHMLTYYFAELVAIGDFVIER
jgi:hypothetical protein